AEAVPPRPAAAVRIAPTPTLPESLGHQPAAQGLGADEQALFGQLLAGQGRAEVGVVPAVGGQDRPAEGAVEAVVGGPATQAVGEGMIAAGLELAVQAADVAHTGVEASRRFGLGAFAVQDAVHDLEDIAFLLTHGYPVAG